MMKPEPIPIWKTHANYVITCLGSEMTPCCFVRIP